MLEPSRERHHLVDSMVSANMLPQYYDPRTGDPEVDRPDESFALLRAAVCGSLCTNLISVSSSGRPRGPTFTYRLPGQDINVHPGSCHFHARKHRYPYLVYFRKQR